MKKLTLLSLLFLTLFACRKDIDETSVTEITVEAPTTTLIDYNPDVIEVTASLFGNVVDENDLPIAGAEVKLGSNVVITDDAGRFILKEMTMNQLGTYVEASKNGYFPGSHRFFPKEGTTNYAVITLLTRTNSGNFVSTDGGVITTADGVEISFPANSIKKANGTAYEGTVEVAARWIDPTEDNVQGVMPGGLQGANAVLEDVALSSFSMVVVELESPSGEKLNVGNNNLKASLTFPIPDELINNAPDEIPLWSFNTEYGIWVEEGSATKEGNTYVGDVGHFSFWNCDDPDYFIHLSGTVVSDNGTPIPNVLVSVEVVGSGISGSGWTNSNGEFGGFVPKDEELIVTISYYGACEFYNETVGPFSVDTDLGTITIDGPEVVEVSAVIQDCDGNPVDNGWVELTLGQYNQTYYIFDGVLNAAFYGCDLATELTVLATDIDNLEVSDLLTFTVASPMDLGTITACGNVVPEWFNVTLDGNTSSFFAPSIFINPGPDSTWIESGYGAFDNSFNVIMNEITGTGSYTTDVTNINFYLESGNNGWVWSNCSSSGGGQVSTCDVIEFEITTYGPNLGDDIIGTFSGNAEVMDSLQGIVILPYSGDFKIQRDN